MFLELVAVHLGDAFGARGRDLRRMRALGNGLGRARERCKRKLGELGAEGGEGEANI